MVRTTHPSLALHEEGQALQDTGDVQLFQTSAGPGGSLKVTLVWTDPPGANLQNDLDLIVECNGLEAHGNVPVGSPAFDRINNVEQVTLTELPPHAPVTLRIRAHRIALSAQKFGLVIRSE